MKTENEGRGQERGLSFHSPLVLNYVYREEKEEREEGREGRRRVEECSMYPSLIDTTQFNYE